MSFLLTLTVHFRPRWWAAASVVAILINTSSSIGTIVVRVTIILFFTMFPIVTIHTVTSVALSYNKGCYLSMFHHLLFLNCYVILACIDSTLQSKMMDSCKYSCHLDQYKFLHSYNYCWGSSHLFSHTKLYLYMLHEINFTFFKDVTGTNHFCF